jgi:hypothetical protein
MKIGKTGEFDNTFFWQNMVLQPFDDKGVMTLAYFFSFGDGWQRAFAAAF